MAIEVRKGAWLTAVVAIVVVAAVVGIVVSCNSSGPLAEQELAMTVALDRNGMTFVNYCRAYNNTVLGIPFTLFIDSDGLVRYVRIGAFASESQLSDIVYNLSTLTPRSQLPPDFNLPTLTGSNITLNELRGTPAVLNFWSISCYWCRKQLPYFNSLADQSGDTIEVVAVNVGDDLTEVKKFFGISDP